MWPHANVAICTGTTSGIVVLDADPRHGGDESLYDLERQHGRLPPTASVVTPSGGQHFYFLHPAGREIRNSAGRLGTGVDIRGQGGYALAPPSAGIGGRYEPDARVAIAPLPAWLVDLVALPANPNSKRTPPREWVQLVRDGVSEGERNDHLTRLVGHLLRRDVQVDVVAELAHLVNSSRFRPPLDASEVEQVINSIAGAELRRRQHSKSGRLP